MKSLLEIENTMNQIFRLISSENRNQVKLNANGGNSILIVCSPDEELEYIKSAYKILSAENFKFLDINKLLVDFIEENKNDIMVKFDLLQSSPNQIFKAPEGEYDNDFFNHILNEIQDVFDENKIPFLHSVGAIYGTGIENIHIIEHKVVMESKLPLIILYPATNNNDKLMFLNSRPSSKYRCMVIN